MKIDASETGAMESTVADFFMIDLSELQLGLVGGGTGEVVIA